MSKRKITCEIYSYGVYDKWNRQSKAIPKLMDITTRIPIVLETEFGYVLKIKGAKGKVLEFIMDHPPMTDENGKSMPPFEGTCFVDSNDFEFFLGDTVWEPYEQMAGTWHLTTLLDGKIIAAKKLTLVTTSNDEGNGSIKNE
ncbi:MAG: DUF3859 domain-containing protein [Marinilabiliaceae bacterium]|nr:DUF3859 domain-containing protein [Marinilabiliaceae bacterium]